MKYKILGTGVFNTETRECIPNNPDLVQWKEYEKWVKDGGIPDPEHTLEELQAKAISQAESDAENEILKAYSIFKMICINELQGHTKDEKTAMWEFINAVRDKGNKIQSSIMTAKSKDEIEFIKWNL